MARTALTTITRTSPSGTLMTGVAVAADTTNGNTVTWTPDLILHILNGDDASITVTIPTPGTVGRASLAISDVTNTIAAATNEIMGPFGRECVQADGTIAIDFTGTTITGVMIAPLRVY